MIAFPASADAAYVNGVVLPVDGGLAASNGQPNFLAKFARAEAAPFPNAYQAQLHFFESS